jgi:exopolyphosphatase/guanosine-5'-triphosphate,3'-diphosphate pyrophosphatase
VIALLDLGSNAARFMLVKIRPGRGFVILEEERVQTRLAGSGRTTLPAPAVRKTLRAIHGFLEPARRRGIARVVALATSAVRDADNAELLLGPLRRRYQLEVRILGGLEEARLGARAVVASMGIVSGTVIDLGGGSLQIAALRQGDVLTAVSVPLGAVRTTARYLRRDPPTRASLGALRRAVRDLAGGVLPPGEGGSLIGLGGTVRALARIKRADAGGMKEIHGARLSRDEVADIAARLAALPLRRRRAVEGLKSERADIIVAGAVVVEELMTIGDYARLVVCKHGVRHAVLMEETFGRVSPA